MLLNELHAKLDNLWADFWPATELRPLAVVDFINSVFFIRQLDETQSKKERSAAFYGKPVEASLYSSPQADLRWSSFQHLDKESIYLHFNKIDGYCIAAKRTSRTRSASIAYSKSLWHL